MRSCFMHDYNYTQYMIEIVNQQSPTPSCSFYFFINTRSGNGEGAKLAELAPNQHEIKAKVNQSIEMHLVDLFDPAGRLGSFNLIEGEMCKGKRVYVIVCGGDGTVSWVVNQMVANKINIADLVFGLLPIGTGNDLCRSLGWDSHSFEVTLGNLVAQINVWLGATIRGYDLWQVTLTTFSNGMIYDIRDKEERALEGEKLSKLFTNYVGLGLDARIVYTMERKRTSSACVNKILYGIVGCLNCFRPLRQLYKKISTFTDKNHVQKQLTESESLQEESLSQNGVTINQNTLLSNGNVRIKKGYRGLVCMNSTSYMCGLRNIWTTKTEACKNGTYDWKPQNSSDGLVEFVAYKNELGMALERLMTFGAKVAQGSGPFEIVMNRPEGLETTYVQIDGESVRVDNLRSVEIAKSKVSEEGRIRMLVPG